MNPSHNYQLVCQHYKALLSEHYTWTFGGSASKHKVNYNLLDHYLHALDNRRVAIDLGCGSGFQTIPLLQLGLKVIAIDACGPLLGELREEASQKVENLPENALQLFEGDILTFETFILKNSSIDVIICMGDTLTHLANLDEVKQLLQSAYNVLIPGGRFILQYRDLTQPLVGVDRFIPVRSDERTVFTCFLINILMVQVAQSKFMI